MMAAYRTGASASFPSTLPWVCACLFAILITAIAPMASNCPAWAEEPNAKHAIPTLEKSVSATGASYGAIAQVEQGASAQYRLVASLPDNVQELATLTYSVHDAPDSRLHFDPSSLEAWIEHARTGKRTALSPTSEPHKAGITINLGDLKAASPDLNDEDIVVIRYSAQTPSGTEKDEFPNVAKLLYESDGATGKTVGSKATVTVPAKGKRQPATTTSRLPQTGDLPPALIPALALCSAVAGLATAIAGTRRKRE
ncbi:MAG: isopeptide-forming domain-containing fimbrial protein [Coriobacteriia bacterium]|nr:isopeptide-forming domain-containing fimbrial protein [Coriobacteriia bacterium]